LVKKEEIPKAIGNPRNAFKVARVRLDNLAGKIVFKNTAGFKSNVEGRKTLSKLKKTSSDSHSINPKVYEIKEKGYVNLNHPFELSIIEKIREKYNKMIEDDQYSFVLSKYEDQVYARMLNRAFKLIPEVKELFTNDIIELVRQYYGSNFQIYHVQMWRNYHVTKEILERKEVFGNRWHCDGANTAITTMFVNLSNVTDKNGPLRVQTIQRTKELLKMGYKSRYDYNIPLEILEDPKHVVKHLGSPGSTIWANTQFIFHSAGIPDLENTRNLMQFRFIPSEDPLREDWPEHCEDNNAENSYNKNSEYHEGYHKIQHVSN